jgi:hypothetical protein
MGETAALASDTRAFCKRAAGAALTVSGKLVARGSAMIIA